jgi:transposase
MGAPISIANPETGGAHILKDLVPARFPTPIVFVSRDRSSLLDLPEATQFVPDNWVTSRITGRTAISSSQRLKHMRWPLLRRGTRVRGRARQKLNALLASLATARAWELKEIFSHFWKYKSVIWAGAFLDYWRFRAMRSRLEPMKKVAQMLRTHEELLLNWFRAKGEISAGTVEGLNNKIRVVTRRSYGFRTYEAVELALYHTIHIAINRGGGISK